MDCHCGRRWIPLAAVGGGGFRRSGVSDKNFGIMMRFVSLVVVDGARFCPLWVLDDLVASRQRFVMSLMVSRGAAAGSSWLVLLDDS